MISQLRRALWKAVLLTMLVSLLGFTIALAASGTLDTTFSGDGRQTTDFAGGWNDRAFAVALQSNGKIVAVGYRADPTNFGAPTTSFAVARYNAGGGLDTTFSGDGKQLTNFSGFSQASGVAIQPDGKIVVSGQRCNQDGTCDLALARYSSGGGLDTTFSGDGKQLVPFGTGDNGTFGGIILQPDGKIVVAGYMMNASDDYDFAVYRLKSDGTLDTTFSGDGKANVAFGAGRQDTAYDLRLQGAKLLVVGSTCDAAFAQCNFALARLNSSGSLDTTFSGDGKQTTDFGASDAARGIALQADGKIVAAGIKDTGTTDWAEGFAVARYTTSGSLDTTFNGTGKKVVALGANSGALDLLVQNDGKIVMAGYGHNGSNLDFTVIRLKADGSVDTTFSGDGKALFDFAANEDYARAFVRQADGKYVLAGAAKIGAKYDFALARILP